MPSENTEETARRFIEALQALERDGEPRVEAMVALFGEGATLTNAALKQAGAVRQGRDGARAFWSEYARTFLGARTTFAQVTHSDRAIGLFWSTSGPETDSRGGKVAALDYDGATLIELDEAGAIAHFHGYYDTRELTL